MIPHDAGNDFGSFVVEFHVPSAYAAEVRGYVSAHDGCHVRIFSVIRGRGVRDVGRR